MPGNSPPRNVVYYNNGSNSISLGGISNLPYTDVILGYLTPDGNLNLRGQGYHGPDGNGAFDGNGNPNPNDIKTLQNAGKNVLISLGGQAFASSAWQQYAMNVNGLVNQVASYVTANRLNGVDIDFEDNYGFTGGWEGIQFLIDLTNGLGQKLPPGRNIITHAPAPNYFDPNGGFNNAYIQVHAEAGHNISWYNCQFYNNGSYDMTAEEKITWYDNIANVTTAPKLVLGAPVAKADTINGSGDGYLSLDEFVGDVIMPLRTQWGPGFGGVMSWEFASDSDGAWAAGTWEALGNTLWTAFNTKDSSTAVFVCSSPNGGGQLEQLHTHWPVQPVRAVAGGLQRPALPSVHRHRRRSTGGRLL